MNQPQGYCPTCRYPIDPGVCPECGSEVTTENIKKKQREFPRKLVTRLLVAVLVPVLGSVIYTNVNFAAVMPTFLLIKLQSSSTPRITAVLVDRFMNDRMSPEHIQELFNNEITVSPIFPPNADTLRLMDLDIKTGQLSSFPHVFTIGFKEIWVDGANYKHADAWNGSSIVFSRAGGSFAMTFPVNKQSSGGIFEEFCTHKITPGAHHISIDLEIEITPINQLQRMKPVSWHRHVATELKIDPPTTTQSYRPIFSRIFFTTVGGMSRSR